MRHSFCLISVLLSLSCLFPGILPVVVNPPAGRSTLPIPSKLPTKIHSAAIFKRSILSEYRSHYTGSSLILPIQAAANYLYEALDSMNTLAWNEWAKERAEHSALTLSKESISITFVSSDPNTPVPWQFIMFFCDELAFEAERGWTGIYQGSWTHLATHVVISITMHISMVAAAA